MKTIIFMAVLAFAASEPDFHHFLEDLDLRFILDNDQELEAFVDCVLDKGPCKELYDSYKDLFSAAFKETCIKCTPYQKSLFWLFLQKVESKLPEDFGRFLLKYDPENKYMDAFMKELEDEGILF